MERALANTFAFFYRALRSVAIRVLSQKIINPRVFSNTIVREYAHLFAGSVVNVSGWDDRDGEGDFYRNYFSQKTTYTVTNAPLDDKGIGSLRGQDIQEITLDLTKLLDPSLQGAFDVVFNHTTLEHIFEIEVAFKNLCAMSKDVIIIVVPVLQQVHIVESFGDYWRPTTLAIAKLFRKNGFEPLILKTNDQPFMPIYAVAIAVRDPKKYVSRITPELNYQMGAALFGSSLKRDYADKLAK